MTRVSTALATAALTLLLWVGTGTAASLTVTSPAFKDGDRMPRSVGCEGGEHSPALAFGGVPPGAKTLAILMTEQDSPKAGTALWMAYNIPASASVLTENQPKARQMKGEGLQLPGACGKPGFCGPCPSAGATRRYVIEVFALDEALDLPENATKQAFLLAVEGHILAKGRLNAKFKK
jgi:Raf kinase inhibitor-like YbhB/YbcL family protein